MKVYALDFSEKYEGIYSYNVFTSYKSLVENLNEFSADISIRLCELTDEKGLEFIDEMFMIERVINYSSGNTKEYDVTISALNSDEENEILLNAFDNMLREYCEKYAGFHSTHKFYKINTIKK